VGGSARLGVLLPTRPAGAPPPPDLMLEVRLTELPPRGEDSSEFRDMLEPVNEAILSNVIKIP